MLTEVGRSLGPATVTEIIGDRVRLDLGEREVHAQLALAVPYQPVPGDVVLAIGEEEYYVIGVLLGRGKTVFQAPGTLELRGREINLVGENKIQLQSPLVQVKADRVETIAKKIIDRCLRAYQWVREVSQIRAGRMQTNVNGQHLIQAERIVHHGKKDVRINGNKIHLG